MDYYFYRSALKRVGGDEGKKFIEKCEHEAISAQSPKDLWQKINREFKPEFFPSYARGHSILTKAAWVTGISFWLTTIIFAIYLRNTDNEYLYISTTSINSFGLLLNIVGAVLLLFFALPIQVALKGKIATNEFEYTEEDQKKIRRQKLLSRIGLCFLIAGFLLQLISNYIT